MENKELTVYEQKEVYVAPKVNAVANRMNYDLFVGNITYTLKRGVDFGKVPKAKTPTLWKSGAEKVLMGFGLRYDIEITDSYKDFTNGLFYYECKAIAYDPEGNVFRVGVGSANTSESSNGMASGFNTANSALKKAKKRAIVDLALSLGGLSDCFTQDVEDDNNEELARKVQKDDDFISAQQAKRIFAIAQTHEISAEKAKSLIMSWGYASTKDIKVKDYDMICEKMAEYGKTH